MKKSIGFLIMFSLFIVVAFSQQEVEVDHLIRQYYQEDAPGVTVAIVKDGATVYKQAVGLANLSYRIPISDATVFQLASVSKHFTAYLALLLEQEGKLRMEEDVRTYLPELEKLPHRITLTQLANHTHGLPNVSELANIKGFGLSDRMWHRDVVDMALRIETFNFQPGERYEYNNTGFVLLAEVIERQSGMPFQEALDQYIFAPLEMKNTLAVASPDQIVPHKIASYAMRNGRYVRFEDNIMSNGSSGVHTTIDDLARWTKYFQATVNDENSLFARMLQASVLNSGTTIPYGLGLETKNYKGVTAVFHGGGSAGHRAYTLHIPAHNLSVLVLGNGNDYWPLALAYEIVDLYLGDLLIADAPVVTHSQNLKSYEGTYAFCPGNYYHFTSQNDSLFLEILGNPGRFYLQPLGNHAFVYPFYPAAKFIFDDQRVDLSIADFIYQCPAVTTPVLTTYSTEALAKFTGFYRNEALNTTYEIVAENEQLIARHPINHDIALIGLEGNSFFSMQGFFAKLDFEEGQEGECTGFRLSGQNLKNLLFTRVYP
jgi:CubicO group peptidase (beta-lactamase class C family)